MEDQKPIVNLPKISEKHIAVAGLVIIAVVSAYILKVESESIITAVVGAIAGFIAAGKEK